MLGVLLHCMSRTHFLSITLHFAICRDTSFLLADFANYVLSSPSVFGIIAQVATYAVATPLYGGLQLSISSTSSRPNVHSISIPRAVLNALPVIFILGYILPSALMLLPAPDVVTFDQKQILIALWQPWPVYVSIMAVLARVVLSPFTRDETDNRRQPALLRKALRRVYAFAFANAAIFHLAAWTISIASAVVPVLFHERFVESLHPARVFGISLPWGSPTLRVSSFGEGVHVFLQWDFLVGSTGVLLWATTLYVMAHRQILGKVGWVGLVVKIGLLSLVAGPVATAVELVWERDELVIEWEMKGYGSGNKKSN
jgi:hypothetical protein